MTELIKNPPIICYCFFRKLETELFHIFIQQLRQANYAGIPIHCCRDTKNSLLKMTDTARLKNDCCDSISYYPKLVISIHSSNIFLQQASPIRGSKQGIADLRAPH